MPREIFIDYELCLGCKSCEIACAVEHSETKELLSVLNDPLPPRKRIFVCSAFSKNIPLNCSHCEDAPCLRACPTGALYKEGDLILHARAICLGCGACETACPFGVITRYPNSKVIAKCDRCPDRNTPACVEACPTGAIKFDHRNILEGVRQKAARSLVTGI